MATNKPPQRRIQGIRGSIPSGYLLGRISQGEGDVELIAPAQALGNGLFPSTKISLVMPAQFSVAGSPVTNNGTFTVTWANESPNLVLAGPASGGAAVPTFRALVAADIPNLGANPTATASDVAVNGNATTYMRSDGAPAVQKASASVFGIVKVDGSSITASGGIISAAASPSGAGNLVFATPNGSSGAASLRALVGADLPNPSASTLGGVESLASVASKWINQISTSGVPSATQPAATDLSDYATGTWTPTDASGSGITFTANYARYTKIGRLVLVEFALVVSVNSNANSCLIGGLPFTIPANSIPIGAVQCAVTASSVSQGQPNNTEIALVNIVTQTNITNQQLSGGGIRGSLAYSI